MSKRKWHYCHKTRIFFVQTKLRMWLGPEFEPFVNEERYWTLEKEENPIRLYGFGVTLVFGETEEW